jgi:hypothetical protein
MRDHRNLRLVSVLTITAALTFSVFASTALAALPTIVTGGGTSTSCDPNASVSGAEPSAVSPGGVVAFRIWARNCDTSSVQSFTLSAVTTPNASVYDPPGDAIGVIPSRAGTCAAGPSVSCSFGTFAPGDEIFVLVAFVAPSSGQTLNVDFQWKTTGQGPDPKKRSHGDTAHWLDSVDLNGTTDYSGHFAFDSSLLLVGNGTNLGNNNKQSTAVDATALAGELGTGTGTGIPLTVEDGTGLGAGCVTTSTFTCPTTFFGETSFINVGNNFVFDNAFNVTITIYKGPNANQVTGIYHGYIDENGNFQQESIASFSAQKVGVNLVLTFPSHFNGQYRGY